MREKKKYTHSQCIMNSRREEGKKTFTEFYYISRIANAIENTHKQPNTHSTPSHPFNIAIHIHYNRIICSRHGVYSNFSFLSALRFFRCFLSFSSWCSRFACFLHMHIHSSLQPLLEIPLNKTNQHKCMRCFTLRSWCNHLKSLYEFAGCFQMAMGFFFIWPWMAKVIFTFTRYFVPCTPFNVFSMLLCLWLY